MNVRRRAPPMAAVREFGSNGTRIRAERPRARGCLWTRFESFRLRCNREVAGQLVAEPSQQPISEAAVPHNIAGQGLRTYVRGGDGNRTHDFLDATEALY